MYSRILIPVKMQKAIFSPVSTGMKMCIRDSCVTVQFHLLPNSDVSEISIVMSYVFYIILYYKVFCLYRSGEVKGIWRGAIVPFLAALGSLFILLGGLQNILFLFYAGFCLAVVFLAFLYYQRKQAELHGSRLD